ncbi:acetamidase [Phenylobacterium hankyongense]|uniref:Acetamidase n=1 Tax=Phenylobacterium hankyongense TaxID=1813876 RepID=A0A328B107_9CAUL|nr:acetamidase/formamidase family protein [Phenylobacterium hankyongense]RAK61070.1 acetamidase [Phenylobacterium hankyongense]
MVARKGFGLGAALGAILLAASSAAPAQPAGHTFVLEATPTTVAWGNYDAAARPVLTIHSGDTVVFHTLLTSSPTALEKAGVPSGQVEASLRDVFAHVTDRGPGGHILTGPVYIEGAEPGDTLEIRILKIDLAIPYAYNGFRYGAGILTDDFPYARMKIIPLDRTRMVANFAPGVTIPLRPFFGSMGVAPPASFGRYDSTPPTISGGNMDNKELVAGTTLYLPVYNKGALFEIGDGHAGQGNGEVDVTAMETSLVGTVQFIVRKDLKAGYPRAETPTHYIAMGFDDDLAVAARKAVREMVDFMAREKGLSRDDAYMLVSVAGDTDITEVVDRNKGVHVMMPKAIFAK